MKLYYLKYIFITFVFIISLFILPNTCKADFDVSYNDNIYVFPGPLDLNDYHDNYYTASSSWDYDKASSYNNIFICYSDSTSYFYIFYFNGFLYHEPVGNNVGLFSTSTGNILQKLNPSNFILENGKYVYHVPSSGRPYGDIIQYFNSNQLGVNFNPIFSSVDIYNNSSLETVVFQGAPMLESEIPETVAIPVITATEQIPMAIIQTLTIVLPVGLVLLGICLVVYLIPLVVYRVR